MRPPRPPAAALEPSYHEQDARFFGPKKFFATKPMENNSSPIANTSGVGDDDPFESPQTKFYSPTGEQLDESPHSMSFLSALSNESNQKGLSQGEHEAILELRVSTLGALGKFAAFSFPLTRCLSPDAIYAARPGGRVRRGIKEVTRVKLSIASWAWRNHAEAF